MTFRSRHWLAAALGVCIAPGAHSPPSRPASTPYPPGRCPPFPRINESPTPSPPSCDKARQLHGYNVDVDFQNGVARLTGTVTDTAQREEVLRLTHGVPGVERVLDRLTTAAAVTAVRAEEPPPIAAAALADPGAAGRGAATTARPPASPARRRPNPCRSSRPRRPRPTT